MDSANGFLGCLACGPVISTEGLVIAAFAAMIARPGAYFMLLDAFRGCAAGSAALSTSRIAWLTALRLLIGLLVVGALYASSQEIGGSRILSSYWPLPYCGSLAAWYVVGRCFAGIRGLRLAAMCVFGVVLGAALDVGIVGSPFAPSIGVFVLIGVLPLLAAMRAAGRRMSLERWGDGQPQCHVCRYNLTGNVSGICPECGTPILSPDRNTARS